MYESTIMKSFGRVVLDILTIGWWPLGQNRALLPSWIAFIELVWNNKIHPKKIMFIGRLEKTYEVYDNFEY